MSKYRDAYLNNRSELGRQCLTLLENFSEKKRILNYVFWENLWSDENGEIHSLFYDETPRKKQNVQSFDIPAFPEITRCGSFRRLPVTENWVLDMAEFGSWEQWFSALTAKSRKKMRWLRNAFPKEGIRIVPIDSYERFSQFEELYSAQFPKHVRNSEDNRGVWRIYEELERLGKNFSFLLLNCNGEAVAANLGYINGEAFNFTHLTRKSSELDKFSPGFYLTAYLIEELFTSHKDVKYFFMGPGKYDYKITFLAKRLPIYRYVRNSLGNIFTLLQLYNRLKKEQKKYSPDN